jgi:DNA-binding LytR/AlgR family response regulator
MPTALIAEDEPMLLAQLKARLAEAWAELRIVAEAMNGEEALALAASHAPTLPSSISACGRSGLEVARELGGDCHLVFVTPMTNMRLPPSGGRVDYVLKPPTAERMAKVVERPKSRAGMAPLDLTSLLNKLAARDGGPAT